MAGGSERGCEGARRRAGVGEGAREREKERKREGEKEGGAELSIMREHIL